MNLPNKLTVFRIILVPIMIFVWLFPYEQFNFMFYEFNFGPVSLSSLNIVVLVIFALASITDMLDGMIARKYNMITTFGKFADPIADKLLVNTTLIIMVSKHLIPVLPVVIMSKNGVVVAAGYLGKLKTVSQMITIILVLLNNLPFELYGIPMASIVLWFATLTSVMGGYSYFIQLKDYIFESK